jgi:hypothetical protein
VQQGVEAIVEFLTEIDDVFDRVEARRRHQGPVVGTTAGKLESAADSLKRLLAALGSARHVAKQRAVGEASQQFRECGEAFQVVVDGPARHATSLRQVRERDLTQVSSEQQVPRRVDCPDLDVVEVVLPRRRVFELLGWT